MNRSKRSQKKRKLGAFFGKLCQEGKVSERRRRWRSRQEVCDRTGKSCLPDRKPCCENSKVFFILKRIIEGRQDLNRSKRSPKKAKTWSFFWGNFARTAKLANEGDAEGCDRKSQTDAENPVCPIKTLFR